MLPPTMRCVAALVIAVMCGHTAAQPAAVRELRIEHGVLPPGQRVIKALKGDALHWRITSDAPGVLHLHAYRLQASPRPGAPADLAFTAFATGRFRVEWHPAATTGAAPAGHDAPALAVLEVRPR